MLRGTQKRIIPKVRELITEFIKHTRHNPIVGKFNHRIFFEPDARVYDRGMGVREGLIELALHSLTSKKDDNTDFRYFDSQKYGNVDKIFDIVNNAIGWNEYINKQGRPMVGYYGATKKSNRYHQLVFAKTNNGLNFVDIKYVTHLPSVKKNKIEGLKNASVVNPSATDRLQQSNSDGTTSSASNNNNIIASKNVKSDTLFQDYRGVHTAPIKEGANTLDNATGQTRHRKVVRAER